jgi:hypothetical protein
MYEINVMNKINEFQTDKSVVYFIAVSILLLLLITSASQVGVRAA